MLASRHGWWRLGEWGVTAMTYTGGGPFSPGEELASPARKQPSRSVLSKRKEALPSRGAHPDARMPGESERLLAQSGLCAHIAALEASVHADYCRQQVLNTETCLS